MAVVRPLWTDLKLGGDTLELGRKGVKKLEQGAEFVLEQGGRFGRFVSGLPIQESYRGSRRVGEKNSPKLTAVLDWLSEQKGILGKVGKKFKPVLQLGKYLPFIGDALGFGLDLPQAGIDWRRALIRMVTGLAIDAGFTTLMTVGVAGTFTGGASGLLATAIYAAYMATDFAAGGFGAKLGDKISDFLKIPMYAGDKALAEPKAALGLIRT